MEVIISTIVVLDVHDYQICDITTLDSSDLSHVMIITCVIELDKIFHMSHSLLDIIGKYKEATS